MQRIYGFKVVKREDMVRFAPDDRTKWQKFSCWWSYEVWPSLFQAILFALSVLCFELSFYFMVKR